MGLLNTANTWGRLKYHRGIVGISLYQNPAGEGEGGFKYKYQYIPRTRHTTSSRTKGIPLASNMFAPVGLRVESLARGASSSSSSVINTAEGMLLLGTSLLQLLPPLLLLISDQRGGEVVRGGRDHKKRRPPLCFPFFSHPNYLPSERIRFKKHTRPNRKPAAGHRKAHITR